LIARILLLFFLYLPASFASVVITDKQDTYDAFNLLYRYDATGQLSIDTVSKTDFPTTIPSQFTLGYHEGSAWFKITVENRSHNHHFVLSFSEPFWSQFDLYEPTAEGWKKQANGLNIPLNQRSIQDPSPAFRLQLASGEKKTYYLHGRTSNAQLGSLTIYAHETYFNPSRLTLNTFYLFYSGVLFIIMILNLFLLAEMRERIYAYYIGYVLAFILFISMFSGSYLMFGFGGWGTGLHTVGTVVMAFMALFSSEFLELKTYFPRMNLFFKISTVLFLAMGVLISQSVPYVTLIFNLFSAVLVMTLFGLALRTWVQGHIQTRYYLIALIIYMPTMAMMVLTFNTLLPNTDFTRYSFLFGALAEIIFFSLILASKFHTARYDEIRLQKELLAEKQKNQDYLEQEIDRQRREIHEKNAMLFQKARYAAMGEMIGNIAHQWRQPLNILSLILINIKDNHRYGNLTEQQLESLTDKADVLIQKMSTTIDDFRNFFQPNKEKKEFCVLDAVKEAYALVDVAFNQHGIHVDIRIDPSYTIFGYKNEFSQVLLNLLSNSRDAFEEHRIRERNIEIGAQRQDNSIILSIKDNGGGIPPDVLPRVFDPYFSTKEEGKGTGIGLYMSKNIIEAHHHGSLSVTNDSEGAVFLIQIPIADTAPNQAEPLTA